MGFTLERLSRRGAFWILVVSLLVLEFLWREDQGSKVRTEWEEKDTLWDVAETREHRIMAVALHRLIPGSSLGPSNPRNEIRRVEGMAEDDVTNHAGNLECK